MAKFTPVDQFHAKLYANGVRTVFNEHSIGASRIVNFQTAPRYLAYGIRLNSTRDFNVAYGLGEKVAYKLNASSVRVERDSGLLYYQVGLPPKQWQTIYTDNLDHSNGLGVGLGNKEVEFNFDEPHTLVAGTTGSGKTEAVNTMITAIAKSYSPDEVKFAIIDPHSEFLKFNNLAHLARPIAREKIQIQNLLGYIYTEFIERKAKNIRDRWRLVVLMDETQSIIRDPDYQTHILEMLGEESRKFRIHLLACASDTRKGSLGTLPRSISNKFIGFVPNANESHYVTGYAQMQAHLLTGKGDFLHIRPGGITERFQVALANQKTIEGLERAEIQQSAKQEKIEVSDLNVDLILSEESSSKVGRPKEIEPLPEIVAWYLKGGNRISIVKAESAFTKILSRLLGMERTFNRNWHDSHKGFVTRMNNEMDKYGYEIVVRKRKELTR